ncbi:MAG: hypothetical protein IKN74_00915 [Clostridia bacterium]|nr:hypothetical protein [Clostridia bacterium]
MGNYGSSITSLIMIVFFIIFCFKERKIKITKEMKPFLFLTLYLMIINVVYILYMYLTNELEFYSIFLPLKACKGFLYWVTNVGLLVLLFNLQSKIDERKMLFPFFFSYLFLFIILIIEKFNPHLLDIFHNTTNYYESFGRIRLLCSEVSNTSTLIFLNYILSIMYILKYTNFKRFNLCIITIIFVIFLLTTTSKGMIAAIAISLVVFMFINANLKLKHRIGITALGILFLAIFFPKLMILIQKDIRSYTSIATRICMGFSALCVSLKFPFGVGNSYYIKVYANEIKKNIGFLKRMNSNLNFNEIYNILASNSEKNLAAKSAFLQYSMYWGICASICFFNVLFRLYRKLKDNLLIKFGFIFLIVNIVGFIDFDYKYEIFSYISVVLYYIDNYHKAKECDIEKDEKIFYNKYPINIMDCSKEKIIS